MLAFIQGSEWLIIGLAVLLLFGAKKLPELARGLGKGIREFKKASSDIGDELNRSDHEDDHDRPPAPLSCSANRPSPPKLRWKPPLSAPKKSAPPTSPP
jgi:sec-independent protein translocase protein TatA